MKPAYRSTPIICRLRYWYDYFAKIARLTEHDDVITHHCSQGPRA